MELDDSPECDVDISLVVSRAVAKKTRDQAGCCNEPLPVVLLACMLAIVLTEPSGATQVCAHDAFPVCDSMITANLKVCKIDYW